jgi:hypothetical protein
VLMSALVFSVSVFSASRPRGAFSALFEPYKFVMCTVGGSDGAEFVFWTSDAVA